MTTSLTLPPAGLTLDVAIQGYAPVPLTSDDGRISLFPRAWALVTADDGRRGIGWLEWNRNT